MNVYEFNDCFKGDDDECYQQLQDDDDMQAFLCLVSQTKLLKKRLGDSNLTLIQSRQLRRMIKENEELIKNLVGEDDEFIEKI